MEEDQEPKHTCKFCSKSFPCGRSLGGHMRSHLITIDRKTEDHNLPKKKKKKMKKLPPLTSAQTDVLVESGGIKEHPNKALKFSKRSDEDTLREEKLCKECGKSFQSWKALFGHMKCHSLNNTAKAVEEDSWISCSDDHHKLIMGSQSISDDEEEEEASTPLMWKRKRSNRTKRYTSSTTNSSSNLSIENSEIDDQEQQEEVALSLILLSRNHTATNWDLVEASKNPKKIKNHDPRKGLLKKISKNDHELQIYENKNHVDHEAEVNSPKNLRLMDHFDSGKTRKFICIICKKGFNSYQALGGHRASHKKFKGCCDPTTTSEKNSIVYETEDSRKLSGNINVGVSVEKKMNKDNHECPICFRVFPSGQALGGHKRSHLINGAENQAKISTNSSSSVSVEKKIPEFRNFLDLNLPAPTEAEEEENCDDLKPWWIGTSHKHEPVIGFFSS